MTSYDPGRHDAETYIAPSSGQRGHLRSPLPTRVRNACDRCRRHKSRCDPFRPCSVCVRANAPCRQLQTNRPGQVNAKKRAKSRQLSSAARAQGIQSTETLDNLSRDTAPGPGSNAPSPIQAQTPTTLPVSNDPDEPPVARGIPRSMDCSEADEAESAFGIARRLCELGSHRIDEQITFAIPGGQAANTTASLSNSATAGQRVPIDVILSQDLPSMGLVYSLVDEFFHSVHWFSLAIYEPKFRKRLHSIADGYAHPSQRSFLLLLSIILGMAAWYRSRNTDAEFTSDNENWGKLSANMIKTVESNLVELMDQPSVMATQTCILLGSHNVYHGRPNLSFSLLGATIKMAHSIGLQRKFLRGDPEDTEERKRVWWTIYTWDRFASITYGRPLGINDNDCNLEMPSDILENPHFSSAGHQGEAICYSTYQRELNKLYLIASPALDAIFGSRTFRTPEQLTSDSYFTLVKHATKELEHWRSSLPAHLSLDLNTDFVSDGHESTRAYALQSLSLQLTYDNILIVLHRPLLTRQVHHLSTMQKSSPAETAPDSTTYSPVTSAHAACQSSSCSETAYCDMRAASSELWMDAAVRTSKITELPALVRLATDSHLVAFLAINLFHAAIVLAVLALSEPLSDTAQEAKRTITRIFRVQDLIGKRSALSRQSTIVLKNVVALLLRRESEAMLAPANETKESLSHQTSGPRSDTFPIIEENATRLPVNSLLSSHHSFPANEMFSDVNRLNRLDESLASVQHALGPGDDQFLGAPPDGNFHRNNESIELHEPSGTMPQMFANNWNVPGDTQGTGAENFFDQTIDGGLTWLWDMTWNVHDR